MEKSGTGLGLTIVWNTIQDHGGDVVVESGSGGTTFTLYFPATRARIPDREASMEPEKYRGHGERILVVDDEIRQREIAGHLLESLNYEVVTVSSGEEAVRFIAKQRVDLVLLDMIMDPGMSGGVCYEQMVKIQPGLRAIIASGYSENDEVKKTLALGANAFLSKPYTAKQLGTALRQILTGQSDG